jgi:lysophospholipase L1-like esterase
LLLLLFICLVGIPADDAKAAADATKGTAFNREELKPFWKSKTMFGESVLFLRESQSQEARATLLFTPTKILSVKSSSGDIIYKEGKDYRLDKGTGALVVPTGSAIPVKTVADLTRAPGTQAFRLTRRDGKGEILFGAGHEYHDMQVVVTYAHRKNEWKSPPTQFAAKELPLTLRKLKAHKPLSIALFGDSISTGCNASKWANIAPFQPFYGDLLVQRLESVYRSKISLTNFSVGGMASGWGSQNIQPVAAVHLDLVILAWGMNDGCAPQEFIANLQTQMAEVRKANPQTEFILVATMLPNGEWTAINPANQIAYRDAMLKIAGPGVAVADVTAVWEGMLKRKNHFDLTGNGVNHPNDFGHRLYAQVILALLEK